MAIRVREDYRTLTGAEKAAIFMLALGEEHTRKLFEHMDDEEIMEISQTMSTLGKVGPNIVERLFVDFAEQMTSTNALVGTQDSTERMLIKAGLKKDKIDNIMEEIRGPAGRTMWEKLGNVSEEILATFLQKEYPQTVSVVLSKISTDHAARVLALLPEGFALEVIPISPITTSKIPSRNGMLSMSIIILRTLKGCQLNLMFSFFATSCNLLTVK